MSSNAIVKSKLFPPRIAGRALPRQRLLTRLLDARRMRCIVLQGLAGCGKTTLATTCRQALLPMGFDVAWLTLSADDNDIARWLDYLLASFAQIDPAMTAEASLLAGRGGDSEAVERALISLVQTLALRSRDLTLFLDDLDHLTDIGSRWALQWMIDNAPLNLHFVLISRRPPPVSLSRLRDRGHLLELDFRDLRFSPEESDAFLETQLGAIERRDAHAIYERTDGWAAGLQLLSIGWKHSADPRAARGAVKQAKVQDARTFARYFETEVLSRLSLSELNLLTRATACNRFCASLCAAMLGRPDEDVDVAASLARLEADNAFILRIDGPEREIWYRFHPLLGETLSTRFEQLSEGERRAVHERAWIWFRGRGHIEEAMRHAVRAGESAAAADLLERHAQELYMGGNIRSLLGLVKQLPPKEIQSRVPLRLWMARSQLFARELQACAASIESLLVDIPAHDLASRYALTLLRASHAIQRDDAGKVQAIRELVSAAPEAADASMVGGRNNIFSWLHLHRGEYAEARRIQREAPPLLVGGAPLLGTAGGTLQGECLIGLSYALEGDVIEAERCYRDVLFKAEQNGVACYEANCFATACLGEILYELDDPAGTIGLLEARIDLLERISIPDTVLRALVALSDAHWICGHELDSIAYLERLEEFSSNLSLDRLRASALAGLTRRRLQRGEFDRARSDLARLGEIEARRPEISDQFAADEIALATGRAQIEWRIATGDLEGTAALLSPLIERSQGRGRQQAVAHLTMQKAWVEDRLGRHAEARASAFDALRLGRRLGLVRSILDVDAQIVPLIRKLSKDEPLDPLVSFYVDRLAATTTSAAKPAPHRANATQAPPLEPLSERELEIVNLLAQALPNKKIARTLGLSPETVKWHLKNIYGKLGVSGRDEAVAHMRDVNRPTGAANPDVAARR